MLHKVNKQFKAFGEDLGVGDIVETGGWRNERLLLEHRYIARTDAPRPTALLDIPVVSEKKTSNRSKKISLLASPLKRSRKKVAKKSKKKALT